MYNRFNFKYEYLLSRVTEGIGPMKSSNQKVNSFTFDGAKSYRHRWSGR